jgi:pantoate--beta-alanine ligase
VATVVTKLFGIIQPTRSYFGQKDAQQLAVIRTMTRDLNLPVDVVGCPTVREADGLAMSSRNARLGQRERQAATVLYRALMAAREEWLAGEANTAELRATMAAVLTAEPLAKTIYVSVADPSSMTEPVRLIDNLLLEAASVAGQGAGDASTTRGTS